MATNMRSYTSVRLRCSKKLRTANARPTFRSNQILKYKTREFVSSHKKDLKWFLGCNAGIPPRAVCNMAHDTWYPRSYSTEQHGMKSPNFKKMVQVREE